MNNYRWGWQNGTNLGKCTHVYDEIQGIIKHKRFRQTVFVRCKIVIIYLSSHTWRKQQEIKQKPDTPLPPPPPTPLPPPQQKKKKKKKKKINTFINLKVQICSQWQTYTISIDNISALITVCVQICSLNFKQFRCVDRTKIPPPNIDPHLTACPYYMPQLPTSPGWGRSVWLHWGVHGTSHYILIFQKAAHIKGSILAFITNSSPLQGSQLAYS